MRVVAPEIFEIRIPRDLLPFILPQLNPDGIDDMGAVNTDIFRSASTFLMIFLVEGGGGSNTGLSTFVDFLFWTKLFSFWCDTLEWWSLYLHFQVQQWLVYV